MTSTTPLPLTTPTAGYQRLPLGGSRRWAPSAAPGKLPRTGRLRHDIDRMNIVGMKRLDFGKHALTLGGFLATTTGRYFGPSEATTVAHPVTGVEIDTVTFTAPVDSRQLDDIFTLDLSAMWSFPMPGEWEGQVGFEVANVTDEQEVLEVDTRTLLPINSLAAWQLPRELRLKVGFRL